MPKDSQCGLGSTLFDEDIEETSGDAEEASAESEHLEDEECKVYDLNHKKTIVILTFRTASARTELHYQ